MSPPITTTRLRNTVLLLIPRVNLFLFYNSHKVTKLLFLTAQEPLYVHPGEITWSASYQLCTGRNPISSHIYNFTCRNSSCATIPKHNVTFSWNLIFKSCNIWLPALIHMSRFSEDAEVTKCPQFTSTQLSKICVTQSLTQSGQQVSKSIQRFPQRDLNNPRTVQEFTSPGDYFQPGCESHCHSSQDPCAHAGTFCWPQWHFTDWGSTRPSGWKRSSTDASKISHRLDSEYGLLKDFCKILWHALPGKIPGLEQKFPFFPDLSQDLLPWEGSSSSTHTLTPNTYANSIQLTT